MTIHTRPTAPTRLTAVFLLVGLGAVGLLVLSAVVIWGLLSRQNVAAPERPTVRPVRTPDQAREALAGNAAEQLAAIAVLQQTQPDPQSRPAVAASLATSLDSDNPKVRRAAADALVVWGTEAQAVQLGRALNDVSDEVRVAVLAALAVNPSDRAVPPVVARLSDPDDRELARRTLKTMGSRALPAVRELFGHAKPEMRELALQLAVELGMSKGDAEAFSQIRQASLTNDSRLAVHYFAEHPPEQGTACRAEVAAQLRQWLMTGGSDYSAVRFDRAIAHWLTKEERHALASQLPGASAFTRSVILPNLQDLEDEKAVGLIVSGLDNYETRTDTAKALRTHGTRAEAALIDLIHARYQQKRPPDFDRGLPTEVVPFLQHFGTPRSIRALLRIQVINDLRENLFTPHKVPTEVEIAIAAIEKRHPFGGNPQQDVARFAEALADLKGDAITQQVAVCVLNRFPVDEKKRADVLPALLPLCRSPDGDVSLAGARALARWGTGEHASAIADVVIANRGHRHHVLVALMDVRDREAVRTVMGPLIRHKEWEVRQASRDFALKLDFSKADVEVLDYLAEQRHGKDSYGMTELAKGPDKTCTVHAEVRAVLRDHFVPKRFDQWHARFSHDSLQAMGRWGTAEEVPSLLPFLDFENGVQPQTQILTCEALGRIGSPKAIEALTALADNDRAIPKVKKAAHEAIVAIKDRKEPSR